MGNMRSLLTQFWDTISSDTFAICFLAAVLVAAILAYVFGADAKLIAIIIGLGAVTAFVETSVRARQKKGGRE
jgi:small basic protein